MLQSRWINYALLNFLNREIEEIEGVILLNTTSNEDKKVLE